MIMLPISDAKESLEKAKSYAGKATGFVTSAMSSGTKSQERQQDLQGASYSKDLGAQPSGFLDDDDSDDDIGHAALGLDNMDDSDSDEKQETQL